MNALKNYNRNILEINSKEILYKNEFKAGETKITTIIFVPSDEVYWIACGTK